MVSTCSRKPICAPHGRSDVSLTLPLKESECSCDWHSYILSRKIVERFLCPPLSPPGDRWCDVLGIVPACSVSSSSHFSSSETQATLLVMATLIVHICIVMAAGACLLGHFPSLRYVQDSTFTARGLERWLWGIDTSQSGLRIAFFCVTFVESVMIVICVV